MAASNVIIYDRNTALGSQLSLAIAELKSANDRLQTLSQLLTQADAAATPANIEIGGSDASLFGVPAGKGAAFVTDVTGLATALTVANRAAMARLYRG